MDSHNASLSLFQPPPVEMAIDKEEWVEYRPSGQISQGSVIEFNIPSTSTDYINLKKSRLHIKAKIVKPDGSAITSIPVSDEDNSNVSNVALVNLSLHALFRQVDVMLQQKVISPEIGVNYPYKAILDVLLHSNVGAQQSTLGSELFYKDGAPTIETTNIRRGGNTGLTLRDMFTKDGQIVSMEGPLRIDICQQDRAIVNGVQVTVRLFPSNNAFRLMTGDNIAYKVVITDAVYKVCYVKVNPLVTIAHNEAFKLGEALYPICQTDIKTYGIPAGSFNYTADGLFNGDVPSVLTVALVSSEAFSGSYTKNYANFANFNVSYLEFSVNGNSVPTQAFQPDYKVGDYTTEYLSLFYNKQLQQLGNYIDRLDYPQGYAIYVFNIGQTSDEIKAAIKKGHTRLSIRFGEKLDESVNVIAYAQFPRVVKIDQARNVILP